jgi:hypothetical protein
MEANGYTERVLTTNDTRKAAVLLAFGTHLRRHQPLTWICEFPDKTAFFAYRRNPAKKPKMNVSFHFEPDGVDAKGIIKAYDTTGAEDEFNALVKSLGLDTDTLKNLLALHSKAAVQACREALEAREYLVKEHMQKYPESAKVNMVRGKDKTFAMFGTQASKETIAEHLSKIEDV